MIERISTHYRLVWWIFTGAFALLSSWPEFMPVMGPIFPKGLLDSINYLRALLVPLSASLAYIALVFFSIRQHWSILKTLGESLILTALFVVLMLVPALAVLGTLGFSMLVYWGTPRVAKSVRSMDVHRYLRRLFPELIPR